MEKTSDSVNGVLKTDKIDLMNYPHIIDELAEWSINLDSKLSADNSYSVAADLLRCRNISLSSVHSSFNLSLDDKLSDNKESDPSSLPKISHHLYNSWRKLSEIMTTWFPPSQVLVTYAHLRENNCPWQLGYLSSESVQGQALCLVATHWLELMELPNKLQSSYSFSIHDLKQSNDITPLELIKSTKSFTYVESDIKQIATNHPSRITRKWYLSYVDPCPQWRIVTFVSYKPYEIFEHELSDNSSNSVLDNLYYITAIGYSNGSIDIIDLSVDESEKPDIDQNVRRSRIFITSPFTQSINSLGCKKPLFPIILLSFIDISHLLVGHFRGHVDLWHLDWKAKSFPARMMMRIYPVTAYQTSKPPPLLAAVYDPSSRLLVLSSLPNTNVSKVSKSMHKKLGLTCYYVSRKAPYLSLTSSHSTSDVIPGRLVSLYTSCKDISVQLLSNLFRRSSYLTNDNQDAITSMALTNLSTNSLPIFSSSDMSNQLLLGSLHSSGSYSVWLVPSFELLLLIANPQISPNFSSSPANEDSNVCSRPFQIAWWGRPLEVNEFLNQDIQLCVIHESGSIDLLDIKKSGTEFYPKIARKLNGLKLPQFPVFATHSLLLSHPESCSSEIVLLSSCLKEDSTTKADSSHDSSKTIFHHRVRCTRLKSTTHSGLFDHFIRMGKFQKALELSETSKENSEIVYKQMWIRLSTEFWKFKNFEQFIHSTLDSIEMHPLWVIKQCLDYLPRFVPLNVNYTLLISSIRSVLNYGLNMVINNKRFNHKDNIWYSVVKERFLIYLTHLNCLESIIQAELLLLRQSSSSSDDECLHLCFVNQITCQPCLDDILEAFNNFRIHSLLDIAFDWAKNQQFIALNILFAHFPNSIGFYRLLIASSLSETINPNLYFHKLFNLNSNLQNNQIADSMIHVQNDDDDNNNHNSIVENIQCQFSMSLCLTMEILKNPLKLVKLLSYWLIERAIQIDTRSGLTDYALNLISLGLSMCEEIFKGTNIDNEMETCLKQLKKVRRDFIELAQIIYNKNVCPTTILQISNDVTSSINREFTSNTDSTNENIRAFQLNIKKFQHFNSKSILTLLLRINLNQINFDRQQHTSSSSSSTSLSSVTSDKLVSFVIQHLLPHLAEKCSPSDYEQLINHCLLYAANCIGLTGHQKLLESLKLGCLNEYHHDYLSTDLNSNFDTNDYLNILNPYQLLMGLIYVLKEYKLDCSKVDHHHQQHQQELTVSLLSTYLTDTNHLIQSMRIYCQENKMSILKTVVYEQEYEHLCNTIHLFNQLITALMELVALKQSIEQWIDLSNYASLSFHMIGTFYQCSQNVKYFQNFLNYWIQIFSRFIVFYEQENVVIMHGSDENNNKHNQCRKQLEISEATVKKLNDTFYQFYKILSKAFYHCPSESWLKIGLQYALFTSGNDYFLELSKNFYLNFNDSQHVNLCKTIELSDYALNQWGMCLLHAIRTYVNTSVPIRSELKMAFHDIHLSTASNQIIDPNERLARHCLSIVDSLRNNRVNWDASILLAFDKEKSLLNASTYLATINTMLSSSSSNQRLNSFITSPYRLRSLWCHDESFPFIMESSEKKRINLLIHAFMKLIELFSTDTTKSIYDSVYMENVFDSMTLNHLAESFLITIEQVKQCYIRSMYNYLKMHNSIYPKVCLLNLTYKFLNDLIEHSVALCWLECANWAGYQSELFNSENNFICHDDSSTSSSSSSNTTTTVDHFNSKLCSWTYLHALYNIERPKSDRSNKKLFSNLSNIDPMELWSIERYRLHLARYAFTYCTCTDYLNDLTNFIGFCILRLEWISLSMQMLNNNNNNQQNERNFKKLSFNIMKQFVKYVSSDSKQSEMANTNHPHHHQSMKLYLPPFYSDSTNCVFSELASNNTMMDDEFAPIDCSNYGFYEHRLWFVFLMNWSQLDQINIFSNDHDVDCNIYHIWCKTILEVASRDTRLAISYTAIGSKFCQFYSSNSVSCLNYMNEVSGVLLPFLELSNITEEFDSTYRIVLVLLCYTLVSIYESKNVDYNPPLCGCFPSGEYLCSKCCLLIRSENFNQKFSKLQKQLVNVFLIVLRESLIRCLVMKFPSIDFVRFRHDQTYREDTIYGLCATHFSLGLQLCACYHLNQLEGVFCRLECLFRDEDCTNNDRLKQMIASIISRIVKLPNGLELLLNRLQQTVYPFLTQFSQIKLFFDVIPNDDDDDGDSQAIIDGIQIRSHRKLLNILCKLQIADQLFHCVTYQEFIKFLHHSSALHNHPLCIHVKTKSDADVIAKVVEQIQEVNDDDSIDITSLQVGDIYAIFGLKVFYDPTLFESFTEMSDLLKLFKSIAPGNTTNDVARFKNWLNELLYDSEFSKDLSISQRRLVLKSAHTFVSRLNKTIVNSEWSNSGVDEMINGYVSHFEQILYLLNKILFPQENNTNEIDPDGNFHNKYSLPKELYKKLISMKPSNQLAMVDCLKELIFGIINNMDCDEHNKNTDSVSVCLQISTKLQILGCLLPPCLKILEIKNEIWLTILQESLSVCFSILSSIYTVRFEYFAQINFHQHELSTPVFTTNTQIQTLYPHVNDFLNLFIKEQQQPQPAQLDDTLFFVDSIQLLSCFLSNDIIRRLFGQHLFNSYSNTDDNDWEESNVTNLFSIFVNTIKYYLQNSFFNSKLLSHFYDQLLLINVESDEMNEFKNCIECLFQQNDQRQDDVQRQIDNGVVVVGDDDDSFLVIKENVEILRTIIELIDLIVTDDILPEKCDFLQHLWILWYEYCEKSGLVFIDNGLFNSELLIDQWTKFCIPPVEFAKAGLKMLSDYYTTNKPLHSYPPTYQAAILGVALIQSNSDVIHSALSILTNITDQSIIQYLDTNVCCYFLCTHPRQWLNLINQNYNSNAPIIYQKLFSKIFNSLIDLLQFNHHNQAVVYFQLGRNICLLLRNEDLWLEMAQICMIIYRIQPGRIPMQHVMKLVSELEFHEC
ncbi:unnamed protein product [Schistosoma turkestanicum]|nr:unnamed protein product [Schistosoma turkestanicum]